MSSILTPGTMQMKLQKGELVEFYAKDGAQLHGFLVRKSPKSIVVFIHGMDGNFYRSAPNKIKDGFVKKGFSVFLTNNRGHDLIAKVQFRTGKNLKRRIIGTTFERFEDSVHDTRAAIDTMAKLGFKNIFLAGHSTGCQKSVYYLSKTRDKRVKGLILLSPTDDYNYFRKWLGRKWKRLVNLARKQVRAGKGDKLFTAFSGLMSANRFLSVSDLKNIESRLLKYDSDLVAFKKIKIPILALFGSRDDTFAKPINGLIKLLNEGKNFRGEVVVGAEHNFFGKADIVATLATK